ncbi:unnamed protein product [Cladocopium goreaui]|uniref:Iron-sulfur cluster assembly 1 homolog, mitochondrial (Iron-sulfur assembly protein isca1) n=1 Tax=Cladocopium goreaui TaxID=2562237 RepID=A0A9P1D3L5_9DINO|nr:unnamed protein product [Cladocopium goreaui]
MARRKDASTIGVRIGLRQRGCNGMSYTMDYTDKVNKFDEVVETDQGIKVVVDSKAVRCPTAWHRADRATQNEWVMISWLFS